jgi:hypothetical protein
VFEDTVELWESYTAAASKTWPGDVQELAAEMRNRLIQLDIVLEHISRAERDFPADVLAIMRGESRPSRQDTLRLIVEPQLFLEMFYFVAWRMVVAIAKAPPVMFPPKGTKLNVPGITHVRNKLIEHPEQPGGIFKQSIVGTHAGPVLKGSAVVIRTATGKVEPVSGEQGLFDHVRELHDELTRMLRHFLGKQLPVGMA